MENLNITRRKALGGLASSLGLAFTAKAIDLIRGPGANMAEAHTGMAHNSGELSGSAHTGFSSQARVDPKKNGFDPTEILRDFDYGKTRKLASGKTLREWEITAQSKEIEVAPGVKYPAWVYNGRVPGPTLRCQEGERLRIKFSNETTHPHTIHFHGIHSAKMDGVPGIGAGLIKPGEQTVYEFDAQPFGMHLYHCHASPLAIHIAKGMYGAFIVDPKNARPQADEMVMVMNGFDTNFDLSNEIYAVNTVGFAYMNEPIRVERDQLIRIFLLNILEYDPINSFHIHANFFNYFPTGTSLEASEFTDTVIQGQAQRGIVELRFQKKGKFMFHAHISEFAELGWMGFFEVV